MFCTNCGAQLDEGARFCGECGTAQQPAPEIQPEKPKKNYTHWIIGAVSLLVAAVMIAVNLISDAAGKVVVYQLDAVHYTWSDGRESHYDYSFDSNGNYLGFDESMYTYDEDSYSYDNHGNVTRIDEEEFNNGFGVFRKYTFEYTYDDDLIETCVANYDGIGPYEWEFQWDDDGKLVRAEQTGAYTNWHGCDYLWVEFVYDGDGRLEEEYHCKIDSYDPITWRVFRYEYDYDSDGNVEAYRMEKSAPLEDGRGVDPMELEYELAWSAELEYDAEGRPEYAEYYNGLYQEVEFEYDRDGNLEYPGDTEYSYDDHGNLIRVEDEFDQVMEFTYTKVRMTPEAAQRYARWIRLIGLDEIHKLCHPGYFPAAEDLFFYYLIPNPIW